MANQIFILSPANVVTGGVELLHQLAYKLNLLGYDASIFYISKDGKDGDTPEVYQKYHVKIARELLDDEHNIFIFPEVFLFQIDMVKKANRVLWWLSVDNAAGTVDERKSICKDLSIVHLSQSEYSTQTLLDYGVPRDNIYWLSDYINSEFLHLNAVPEEEKQNVVLFNPLKGFEQTAMIILNSTGAIKWQALKGLTPVQMRHILQHSKVYIDFGGHPGRDRIPREATMCGCCLITNKKGSAANDIDVPILEKYKFDEDFNPLEVLDEIYSMMKDYAEVRKSFEAYCYRTAHEFQSFETDILSIFEKIVDSEEGKKQDESHQAKMLENEAENYIAQMITYIEQENYQKAFQLLVKYRLEGYEEGLELSVLEGEIRYGLKELNEAEFVVKEALKNAETNYELLLLLGKIHLAMNTKEDVLACIKNCQQAIEFSKNTEDEDIVFEMASSYIGEVKQWLAKWKMENLNEN